MRFGSTGIWGPFRSRTRRRDGRRGSRPALLTGQRRNATLSSPAGARQGAGEGDPAQGAAAQRLRMMSHTALLRSLTFMLDPLPLRAPAGDDRGGFTLIEALVALSLVLAVAAALGPLLTQARRIIGGADERVAAQALLRTLLDAPLDRSDLSGASRQGESAGLRWRVTAEPIEPLRLEGPAITGPEAKTPWTPFRVVVAVAWGPNQAISAETIRLGRKAGGP
jgi:Prokaryotic N-terminal methylation motif